MVVGVGLDLDPFLCQKIPNQACPSILLPGKVAESIETRTSTPLTPSGALRRVLPYPRTRHDVLRRFPDRSYPDN
jgi:hypothetical protein